MQFSSITVLNDVVSPSLKHLGFDHPCLGIFLTSVQSVHQRCYQPNSFSPYQITHDNHWSVWDTYLVNYPNLASKVRGLASQHRFLEEPDVELNLNLGYATAISAMLLLQASENNSLKSANLDNLVECWSTINPATSRNDLIEKFNQINGKIIKSAA
jgi:hypothetical protein